MKIAYVARCDASTENGVLKKLVAQVTNWRAAGHDASLFLLSRDDDVWTDARGVTEAVVLETGWPTRGIRLFGLTRAVKRWKPDLVYARFDTGSSAMSELMREVPTVLELNSVDLPEYRLYLPWYQYRYHRLVRGKTLRGAAGFVAVTHEIAARYAEFGRPTEVIANGIDLSAYRPVPPSSGKRLRLVFIGAPRAVWHGIDKIVDLASLLPEIDFDLVGPDSAPRLPANVRMYGILPRHEYESVLGQSDAAIATLALHRKSMDEACPLKVREYLAMGIACVIGYRDTDFPAPVPFLLQLKNAEDNASSSADGIRQFCADWHGKRVGREAIVHIDIGQKEAGRLKFMSSVL
ncbi:MAG: glycosyltransferase [Gemmatimonadales bacterium]